MDMQRNRTRIVCSMMFATLIAAAPVLADKPEGKAKGKGHNRGHDDDGGRGRGDGGAATPRPGAYFVDKHRMHVRTYFSREHSRGHCPPGLAKKNNGCMPPGQAKTWQVGQPLPRDVVIYDLPQQLVVQIGIPPAGYRFVRVASDILLIAIGTSMVVDAIRDLGRL